MADQARHSIEDILHDAIEKEDAAFDFYEKVAAETDDPDLKRYFHELARLEHEHARHLQQERERLENERWIQSAISC